MIGENGGRNVTPENDVPEEKPVEEESVEGESVDEDITDTEILTSLDSDNIGDLSVELNVEELVAMLEESDSEDVQQKAEIRRRLEELRERKDAELESTFNFNLDDDL